MVKNKPQIEDVYDALTNLTGAVGDRFDSVDGRFDAVDHRLTDMDQKLDRIEAIILKDHERRLEQLERKIGITR